MMPLVDMNSMKDGQVVADDEHWVDGYEVEYAVVMTARHVPDDR